MYVDFIPGDSGVRIFDVRPSPQVTTWDIAQHLQGLREGMENDRASLTTEEGAQESPRCQSHGFQEGCSASAPQFFQLGC